MLIFTFVESSTLLQMTFFYICKFTVVGCGFLIEKLKFLNSDPVLTMLITFIDCIMLNNN